MKNSVILMFLLAGCAVQPQKPAEPPLGGVTVVKEAVATVCIDKKDLPDDPIIKPDSELLGMDDYTYVMTIHKEREQLAKWRDQIKPFVDACTAK